jgi:hypothetical protein
VKRAATGAQEHLGELGRARKTDGSPLREQCYTPVMSTDELLAEALRLTRVDRARVNSGVRLEPHREAPADLRSAAL